MAVAWPSALRVPGGARGFQPLASGPALAKDGSVREAITTDSADCEATTWLVTSKSMRSSSLAWTWEYQVFWPGRGAAGLIPAARRSSAFKRPGLKPHVGHLDFLLIGASGFLGEDRPVSGRRGRRTRDRPPGSSRRTSSRRGL